MSDHERQSMLPGFEPPPSAVPPPPPPVIQAPTAEQVAIIDCVRKGVDHVLVQALAGTGKTSTILACLAASPAKRVLLCAFGSDNAKTLEARLPKTSRDRTLRAKTIHQLGYGVLCSYGCVPEVDRDATEDLVIDVAYAIAKIASGDKKKSPDSECDWLPIKFGVGTDDAEISIEVTRAARDLVRRLKETCTSLDVSEDQIEECVQELDAFDVLDDADAVVAIAIAHFAYQEARLDHAPWHEHKIIDFCEMIWLPLVLKLQPKRLFDLVLVDEGQDLSRPQFEFVQRFQTDTARLVVVGDLHQSIYSWRGAVGDEVWETMRQMRAVVMPLTASFRCARTIVEVAKELVPEFRACADAPQGAVYVCSFTKMMEILPATDVESFVLSRNNSDLFRTALQLWGRKARFHFHKGKDLAEGLHHVLDKLDVTNVERFQKSLDDWYDAECKKAEERSAVAKIERIKQRRDTLLALLECDVPRNLGRLLDELILASSSGALVTLYTVHGAKGLEVDRAFLLRQTFARHRERSSPGEMVVSQEELNLEYVAITRARRELVWVDLGK